MTGAKLTPENEQCNGQQPCATCVSRNNICTYASTSPDMSQARARHHHENSNQAFRARRFAAHANERIPDDANHSPSATTTTSSAQRRGTASSDTNTSSVTAVVSGAAPGPVEQTRAYGGGARDQFEPVPVINILGGSPELPLNTAGVNQGNYGYTTGASSASHGGQKQAEQVNVNGDPRVTSSRAHSRSSEGERLNEQSRLLNDGKGRLCK